MAWILAGDVKRVLPENLWNCQPVIAGKTNMQLRREKMENPLFEDYKKTVMENMSAYSDTAKIIVLLWIIIKMLFMKNCRGE
jgi:hypothetical protein